MKNREIITRRLEKAEGQIEKLQFYLQRGGTTEQVQESLVILREAIDDAKVFIQQEPISPNEINQY
jgi:hypothetical protein